MVVRLDTSGQLSLVAGNGIAGFSGDGGPAALAELSGPTGVVVDASGNVYIEDAGNNRIRMVANGVITTVAGGGTGDDGPATAARLNFQFVPPDLALDRAGNVYFADYSNLYRIRKLSNGTITTVAGGGYLVADNAAATSTFIAPQGIAIDARGCGGWRGKHLFYGRWRGTISRTRGIEREHLDCGGRPIACPERSGGGDNIPATSATLVLFVYSTIAVDAAGNLYIPDQYWETVPPGGYYSGDIEGSNSFGRLRKVSNGVITTIAGSRTDGGPAATAQLNLPTGVAVDGAGNLYIGDSGNGVLRAVSYGTIGTIAGSRITGGCECDTGQAAGVSVGDIQSIAVDSASNVYMADGAVLRLSQGLISPEESPGNSLYYAGVALDAGGNLYFANRTGNQIQELSSGVLTTIAGTGAQGFGGDYGPATGAELSSPSGVAVDGVGDVLFHRYRQPASGKFPRE